jgi:hypothetical protein
MHPGIWRQSNAEDSESMTGTACKVAGGLGPALSRRGIAETFLCQAGQDSSTRSRTHQSQKPPAQSTPMCLLRGIGALATGDFGFRTSTWHAQNVTLWLRGPIRLERLRQLVPHAERANTANILENTYNYIEVKYSVDGGTISSL